MVRIWETQLKNQTTESPRLPVIIPVVLAQNAEVWQMPCDFASSSRRPCLTSMKTSGTFIPDFTFRLIQLASLPFYCDPAAPHQGIMIMRTMKAERTAALLADPVWDEALLVRFRKISSRCSSATSSMPTLTKTTSTLGVNAIQQLETRSSAMSLAEQLRQEGLEGLERTREGRQVVRKVVEKVVRRTPKRSPRRHPNDPRNPLW